MGRFDNVGLWWQDYDQPTARGPRMPAAPRLVPVPQTGWTPPRDFPNLSGETVIGLDTETKDLELLERGPGAVRGAAHAAGISVATGDRAWYFPIRHEYEGEKQLNMDPAKVFAWLRDLLGNPRLHIVGANLLYDFEVLHAEGLPVPRGSLYDVQMAEPLLDEHARSYSLETLARKYLDQGKESPTLYQWCADSFGGAVDGSQRGNIWRAPPSLVGPYAEADALLPLQVLNAQRPALHEQGLTSLFRMECALIPLLIAMRFRGVRVDVERAQFVAKWLRDEAAKAQGRLGHVDVWSSDSIARAMDKAGIDYPRTEKGAPSFTKDWLSVQEHPLPKGIYEVRMYEKAANPFVESYILGGQHNGRIHCQFNPLRSDHYGTVSGRFSSSNPNLQNIPSRDPVLGPMLRSLFIPEDGCQWRRRDYSQVEYRLLMHFAVGKGAEELRELYRTDPTTDFHRTTQELTLAKTGVTLDRKPAKNLNFGLVYGMGKDKLKLSLGVSEDLAERLYDAYFEALPCVKLTYESAKRLAERRGYIRTVLGRRRRFIDGAGSHAALNACLQGSAADIMKMAMVECWRSGVYDVTGIPHLTVHDELDSSDDGSPAAAEGFLEERRIMETCVPLKVPLLVDDGTGANWGDCK